MAATRRGTRSTRFWMLPAGIAVSLAVHAALLLGGFADYRLALLAAKKERYLMIGRLIPDMGQSPFAVPVSAPAAVPRSSSPSTAPPSSQVPVEAPQETVPENLKTADLAVPTPTPSVLTWDMRSGSRESGPATKSQGQAIISKGESAPVLVYQGGQGAGTGTGGAAAPGGGWGGAGSGGPGGGAGGAGQGGGIPPRQVAGIPKKQVPASVPKKDRIQKKWMVDLKQYSHDELAGGGSRPPKLRYIPDIPYPEQAKSQGIEDHVLLEIEISSAGKVTAYHFARGKQVFRENVVAALKRAEFDPALDHQSLAAIGSLTIDIHFFLQEER